MAYQSINPSNGEFMKRFDEHTDAQVESALAKRYQSRIFVLALRYTRVQADAEDIVQLLSKEPSKENPRSRPG